MNVGDTVYLKSIERFGRKEEQSNIKECNITKVGSKYYYIGSLKFSKEDNKEVNKYQANWKAYFSKQEILDEEEFKIIAKDLKDTFNTYGGLELSLDQLRRIREIVRE